MACVICRGAGWIRRLDTSATDRGTAGDDVVGLKGFERLYVRCPECGPQREAAQHKHRWSNMQIPAYLANISFVTYRTHAYVTDHQKDVSETIEKWANRVAGELKFGILPFEHWLMLTGETGHGKTGLACCALRVMTQAASTGGVYVDMTTFIMQCRQAMNPPKDLPPEQKIGPDALVLRYSGAPILVIDDMGAERLTNWSLSEVLWPIIANRYNEQRPTIITTNLSGGELFNTIANTPDCPNARVIAERIMARITERTGKNGVFRFGGVDMHDLRTGQTHVS